MTKATIVSGATLPRLGRNQKSTACMRNMTRKVYRRVRKSDTQAQKTRPKALPMLTMPTMPAATITLTLVSSWNIGDSCEMIEIPADVFRKRRAQSAHHCQLFNASPRVKSRAACDLADTFGVQPSGFQSAGGFCIKKPAPTQITRYAVPR